MGTIETNLQKTVKGLFKDGRVDLFLGYEQGTLPLRTRMTAVKQAEDAGKLVWNALCHNSLAVYLPHYFTRKLRLRKDEVQTFPKVGIAAKGCDGRAIMLLAREHQILRDHVVIVGVPCQGMVDLDRITAALNGEEPAGYEDDGRGTITVRTAAGATRTFQREEYLAEACRECEAPVLDGADVCLEGAARAPAAERFGRVKDFEAKSPAERFAYFKSELSRCIRCSACRQACPTCYCKECFAENTRPRWVGPGNGLEDVMMFHIGRIMHQAGRCVECDSCVRACPMNIDLRTFTNVMGRTIKDMFGYVPGPTMEEVSPLLAFDPDDDQSYVTEPTDRQD